MNYKLFIFKFTKKKKEKFFSFSDYETLFVEVGETFKLLKTKEVFITGNESIIGAYTS